MKKVCVYCASSNEIPQKYFDATIELSKLLVDNNISVVYGGGGSGLMGKLADTILENNGKIKGIMPRFMDDLEWGHKGINDFEYTDTMHERKAKFLENIDGIICLAGGSGTLEELLEVITLKRLGQFTKPIVILNTDNYYKPLIQMLNKTVEENFMREEHLNMWKFVNEPSEVIDALNNSKTWDSNKIHIASYNN